jgi:hypothetical protein
MQERLGFHGQVIWELRDGNGNLRFRDVDHNLVVDTGLALIAALIAGSGTAPTSMATGSDDTYPDSSDTALGSELARVAFTSVTPTDNEVVWVGTFGPGVGTGTVQEAGLFNASSGGTMLARATHGAFSKGAGDTLTITWTLTLSAV